MMKSNEKVKPTSGIKKGTALRVIKTLFQFYPVMMPLTVICILFNAIVGAIPAVFMQRVMAVVETSWKTGDWAGAGPKILSDVRILVTFYVLSLLSGVAFNQMMAVITQGFLKKMRVKMFSGMQNLPIKYFDTHNHGDIMSHYTNDIDTMRQMVSQSFPQLLISIVSVVSVFFIMIYYSVWLALVVVIGVIIMLFVTKKVAGTSSRFFFRNQDYLGREEGYIEEMMNGQKVVKVFCHEQEAIDGFNEINDKLFVTSSTAHRYANMLMPILTNIGNVLYVIVAVVGGILLVQEIPNISLSGMAISISVVVPFLNMTKQFSGNVSQVSNQINSVVMGVAGAQRIFDLIDEKPEQDNGFATLVNAKEANGDIVECKEHTGIWAWKYPHEDGNVTYSKLNGDVRFRDVDFAYDPDKMILHDISIYAEPGQKVALVGATGAGKTTITNLLNRFYDIVDGTILYDGIDINEIKKDDLRHSLGVILQDTNLFTGTVMDNIRYGRLDATDDECIEAAKLAGADDFVTRLPNGYQTMLSGNGANLSQGQRQLLAISRAAVADPPVLIMDEATSSIDTRTEAIVQRGMDALMEGRTVFVIAHRLSTVKNSDVIMVLDHGRIIERGNHDQLIEKRGTYYQLYTGAFELE
ncbi:ABC transporter ATP-binding protein [Blautia liquoris]|nr:ABC transporter ATP-binding protein [Blautia liquoris]